ncbi:MAG: M1 family aminopeptidase [Candidatus Krumholzibacteria bacterium]|nr:M1 family aminopeptidase [Candidatus Krumholzibacteria bacterium]
MLRKLLVLCGLIAIAGSASAQSPFEKIHGDILRRMEIARAQRSSPLRPLLAPQPRPNQLLYDVVHYTIDVAINPATWIIEGSVTARITPVAGMLNLVELDADNALTITGVRRVPGDALEWIRSSGLVAIDFPAGVLPGDTVDIEILYTGSPGSAVEQGLFFSSAAGYPLIYSLSEPWSARGWWPCKDYPDDKATFDLYFSVPVPLFAASNGTYLGYTDVTRWSAPYRRYHWREDYPMTTYLASVAAANYVRIDDRFVYAPGDTMPVTHYVYPALQAKALVDFNITTPALAFFSETFGLYPFIAEKYGVALCPIGGGMEHQTLTSYGSMLVTGDHYYDWIFVHELSHMWFGDMITCKDWTHIWLNEGFASYCEALWFEHLQGPARLRTYMESEDHPYRWNGPVLRDPDVTGWEYYFDNVVYDKGSWVLHMLRRVVGDEAFFQILKDYCADPRYRFGAAETNDFKALCEARYGSSLSWFFDEWLTRTDRLIYRYSSKCYRLNDEFNLTIVVDQLQTALYEMPVDFRITTASGVIDTVFRVNGRHEEFHVALADSALDAVLDPEHWILCDKTELAPTGGEVPSLAVLDQNYPNPFNPATLIRFSLSEPSTVSLRIYDATGRLVRVLVEGPLSAGAHERAWDGADSRGAPASSGVYLYRLDAGSFSRTRKMILIR